MTVAARAMAEKKRWGVDDSGQRAASVLQAPEHDCETAAAAVEFNGLKLRLVTWNAGLNALCLRSAFEPINVAAHTAATAPLASPPKASSRVAADNDATQSGKRFFHVLWMCSSKRHTYNSRETNIWIPLIARQLGNRTDSALSQVAACADVVLPKAHSRPC